MENRLKEARERAKKTQLETALEIGTTQRQMTRWENEEQDITLRKLKKLADFYNVSIDWIANRTENPEINR